MTNNVNITKPLTVAREEFISSFVDLCNESGLPFFVIEDIMKGMISEIHSASIQQAESDKKRYQEQLDMKTQENV